MKAAILHKNGDPTSSEVLSVQEDVDIPEIQSDEILVKVSAASINPIDWKLMKGDFPGKKSGTVGFDVSGIVDQVGADVDATAFHVGDAVYADAAATQGSFAEFVAVKAVAASLKPKSIDFVQAASLPLAGLTAIQGLFTHGEFKESQKVCILGGSGGVGSLAVQIAKAMGASEVWATGSDVEGIQKLGADKVINYREKSVVDELQGQELDLVFDTIGGKEGWEAAKGALKKGGIFVTLVGDGGSLFAMIPGVIWRKIMSKFGVNPSYRLFLTKTSAPDVVSDMKKLTEFIESGKVKPVLDERKFRLTTESIHEMVEASMSHHAKGKLVLQVAEAQ